MNRDTIMHFLSKKTVEERAANLSFDEWVKQNNLSITSYLMDSGLNFIVENTERSKSPLSHLILDNRWHYLDKAKKESYRGTLTTNNHSVPYLKLTYYTFRDGGYSIHFDSKAALKNLWIQTLNGTISPIIQQQQGRTAPIKPVENSLPVIDYLTRDKAHWQQLSESGVSHYLNRKGLANTAIPGIRFAHLHIAIQIINTKDQIPGLQTIFNDGQKRFTKGMAKKGHFALIGARALPEKITTIHIAEGVATAASINLQWISVKATKFSESNSDHNLLCLGLKTRRIAVGSVD